MNDWYISTTDYQQAKANGISPQVLNNRVRQLCWPLEKAVSTPPRGHRPYRKHKQWANVAEGNGISYNTFIQRVCRLHWTPEKAATEPLADRQKQAMVAREKYRFVPSHLLKLARQNGIKENTFYVRIKRGMTPEEAATMPIMGQAEKSRKGRESYAQKISATRIRQHERIKNHVGP